MELTEHINKTLLSKDLRVTTLSSLTDNYIDILRKVSEVQDETNDQDKKYKSWKLKEKLLQHYNDRLVFVECAGSTDLVCSGNISIGHALTEEAQLGVNKTDDDYETTPPQTLQSLSDSQILHKAAEILRSMENVENEHQFYVSLQCNKSLPDPLYDFVNWCVDSQAHRNHQTCVEEPSLKENLCVITICHSLIAQCRHIQTPITLGLMMRLDTFSHQWQHTRCQGQKAMSTSLMVSLMCLNMGLLMQPLTTLTKTKTLWMGSTQLMLWQMLFTEEVLSPQERKA